MQPSKRLLPLIAFAFCLSLAGYECHTGLFPSDSITYSPPPVLEPLTADNVANFQTFPSLDECKNIPQAMTAASFQLDTSVDLAHVEFDTANATAESTMQECNAQLKKGADLDPKDVEFAKTHPYGYGDPCVDEWKDINLYYPHAVADIQLGVKNSDAVANYNKARANYDKCMEYQRSLYQCVDDYQRSLYEGQKVYRAKVDAANKKYDAAQQQIGAAEKKCFTPTAVKTGGDAETGGGAAKVNTAPGATPLPTVPVSTVPPSTAPAPATSLPSATYGGQTYYVVPAGKTGTQICQQAGKSCVGYTAKTVDVCKHFHPDAIPAFMNDGSNAGFYCNGAPQTGICSQLANACAVCQNCNVNMDCSTKIGDLYREAYIECK